MLFSTKDSFSYVFEKPKMEDFFSLTRRLRNCSETVFFLHRNSSVWRTITSQSAFK